VLTPKEVVAMITYKADIDNALRDAYKSYNQKIDAGQDTGTLSVEIADLERQVDAFDVAAVITANQQSMAFRLRKMMLDRDYNVVKQIEQYKKNNNGVIPADKEKKYSEQELEAKVKAGVQDEINNIYKQIAPDKKSLADKAIAALEKIEQKLKNKTYSDVTGISAFIAGGIATIKNAIKLGVSVQRAVELGINEIKKKLNGKQWDKEDEFRKDMIEGFQSEGVSTDNKKRDKPVINDDGTVTIPNQMLRDLVERGITDIDELTDSVHEQVAKDIPGITKRQVRDYITDYGRKINPTADELQTQVNTAKRVGRLISELEDVQDEKKKEKNASTRGKLTEKEKDLKRKIKTLSKELPLTEEEKTDNLSKAKERVRQRIKELETRLKNSDFDKKKKLDTEQDEELVRLNAQKEKIQEEFNTAQYKNQLKNIIGCVWNNVPAFGFSKSI